MQQKERAPYNRTLTLAPEEEAELRKRLLHLDQKVTSVQEVLDRTICQDTLKALPLLPDACADLLCIDPPYNLRVDYGMMITQQMTDDAYLDYVMGWLPEALRCLKPNGTIYVCCDWRSSNVIYQALSQCGICIRNRITWQREKGRGAQGNWKNAMEDIWYGVKDKNDFYFDVKSVMMKRRVLAPYTVDGQPKDWEDSDTGRYRMTCPSNFWDDISIPFWSMPENTDHPTQKPEKLMAKLILASCPPDGVVLDPFSGSGTTAVTARKLGRHCISIEMNPQYACWGEKRLDMAEESPRIQGYNQGVFWERNTPVKDQK